MSSDAQIREPGGHPAVERSRIDLLPVVSFVLWLTCLIIGLVGYYVRFAPPAAPVLPPPPVQATLVKVTLSNSPAMPKTPQTPQPQPIPDAPPLPQVVAISPAIPFAVPVLGPTRLVPSATAPSPPAKIEGPVYKQITYGSCEGAQPAPDYPVEAYTAGQEGTVMVRYRVAQDGTITSVEVARPCDWPLLNQAAARSIRETWTYPAGSVRYFEISISYRSKPQ